MKAAIEEATLARAVDTAQYWAREFGTQPGSWRDRRPDLWGRIAVVPSPDGTLILLSYTDAAQHAREWTPLERVCRGLILAAGTGAIVARPWPKFFNWGELDDDERARLAALPPYRVSEKLDGSLVILYWWQGGWHCATRGSFTSQQARHAATMLAGPGFNLRHLPGQGWTYLCELLTPANRVVLDYGQREELVLLDIINNESGVALSPKRLHAVADTGLVPVRIVEHDLDALTAALASARGVEGWVVTWDDQAGTMVKFKTAWYLDLHRLVSGFNPERVRAAMLQALPNDGREWPDDSDLAAYRSLLPEEFWPQLAAWFGAINDRFIWKLGYVYGVERLHRLSDDGTREGRKRFAAAVLGGQDRETAGLVFAHHDGKDVRSGILKGLDISDLAGARFDTWKGAGDGTQGGGDEQPDLESQRPGAPLAGRVGADGPQPDPA